MSTMICIFSSLLLPVLSKFKTFGGLRLTLIYSLKAFIGILCFANISYAQLYAPLPSENQQSKKYDRKNKSSLGLKSFENLDIEKATVDTMFSVFSFDEIQDRSQLVQLAILPSLEINLLKNLKFSALGLIGLSTGRVQTRFDNPQFSSLNLNELILTYSPVENLGLSMGALNQNDLNTRMLIADRAFPGVQIKNKIKISDDFEIQLKAQYSIPNSVSFETDRTNNESIPSFLTQGFDFKFNLDNWLKVKGNVHHFTYNDLPSVVAFQSGRLGNTVDGIQSAESNFIYDFDGFSQAYEFNLLLDPIFTARFDVEVIDNLQAPDSQSRSQWTGLGFDWYFQNLIISPTVAYFFAEADSVPALYSDVRLGRNKREGFSYKLKLNFKKSGFSVSANYIQANLIQPDPVQNDLRTFEFLLELPSVKF